MSASAIRRLVGIGLLFLASLAFAQSPLTIVATITDASGASASTGTVTFRLQPQQSNIFYRVAGTSVIAPANTVCGINSSGQLKNSTLSGACQLYGNDVITPTGTTYEVLEAPNNQAAQDFYGANITSACGSPCNLASVPFGSNTRVFPDFTTLQVSPLAASITPDADNTRTIGAGGDAYTAIYGHTLFADNWNSLTGSGIAFSGLGTFSGGINTTNLNNIRFANFFASTQACLNDSGTNPEICINPSGPLGLNSYNTSDTGFTKALLDLNDTYFGLTNTLHTPFRLQTYVDPTNTMTAAQGPYAAMFIDSHVSAAYGAGQPHYAGLLVSVNGTTAQAAGTALYGAYIKGISNNNGGTGDQHAAIEATWTQPGGFGTTNNSGAWAGDFHTLKGAGVADGIMIGIEDGLHNAGIAFNTATYAIATITRNANLVSVTFTGAPVAAAFYCTYTEQVTISGVTGGATAFNGQFPIGPTNSCTTSGFTYPQTGPNESGNAGTGVAIADTTARERILHVWAGNSPDGSVTGTRVKEGLFINGGGGCASCIEYQDTGNETRFKVDQNGITSIADQFGPAVTPAGATYPALLQMTGNASRAQYINFIKFPSVATGARLWGMGYISGADHFGFGPLQTTESNFTRANSAWYVDGSTSKFFANNGLGVNDGAANQVASIDTTGKGTFNGGLSIGTSVANSGTGFKHVRSSTTCTTGAAIGATCTTGAISWPGSAFADTSYTLTCTLSGALTNVPTVINTAKSNGSFTVTIAALTAAAASYAEVDCIGVHD